MEISIAAIVSIAAVMVSATQIIVAYISKSKEIRIAEIDQDRKWKLTISEFIITHHDEVFSEDTSKRSRIQLVMKIAFPQEITKVLFNQIDDLLVNELLAPLVFELNRTKTAFLEWTSKNLYLEAKRIKSGNLAVRDLLLKKANLIPLDLAEDAQKLIHHYDVWLQEFEKRRGENKDIKDDQQFVFAGPLGFPFPSDSERRFIERYETLKKKTEEKKI
jgi:hypothetical protein